MPAGFDKCEKEGGKMRTVSGPNKRFGLGNGEYVHICFDKKGAIHRGYPKKGREEMKKQYAKD